MFFNKFSGRKLSVEKAQAKVAIGCGSLKRRRFRSGFKAGVIIHEDMVKEANIVNMDTHLVNQDDTYVFFTLMDLQVHLLLKYYEPGS